MKRLLARLLRRSGGIFLAAALLTDCRRSQESKAHGAPGAASHATLAALAPAGDASLYDLPVALVDQNDQPLTLDAFRGHPLVISMFYASCPYACPTLIAQLQRLDRELPTQAHAELRVLLVSFDPERDSAHKLKQLSVERHVDETRWHLARASADDVRLLAAALGIKYRRLDDGAFNHSSVLTVLDQQGYPRARSDGLGQQVDARLSDALTLLARN